jgi:dihydroorotase
MSGRPFVLDDVALYRGAAHTTVRITDAGAVVCRPAEIPRGDLVYRCGGAILTPGLADIHVHTYRGATHVGVGLDERSARSGVTTIVDAGSAGAFTFAGLSQQLTGLEFTRGYALVNISGIGLAGPADEHASAQLLGVADVVACVRRYRDQVLGIKVRLNCDSVAGNGHIALAAALAGGGETGLPLMVDFGWAPPHLDEFLGKLRPGDILTHCFIGGSNRISSPEWSSLVQAALDRGVVLDIGHGMGSFNFDVAEAMIGQGVMPRTISSDLHRDSAFGPAFDLLTVASKVMAAGMPLDRVIEATTLAPRRVLGLPVPDWPYELGGDLALIRPGPDCQFFDVDGGARSGPLLDCLLTVRDGEVTYQSPLLEPVPETLLPAGPVLREDAVTS